MNNEANTTIDINKNLLGNKQFSKQDIASQVNPVQLPIFLATPHSLFRGFPSDQSSNKLDPSFNPFLQNLVTKNQNHPENKADDKGNHSD